MDPAAWDIMHEFALSDSVTLPDVESHIKTLLGSTYMDQDWLPAINAVLNAENDTDLAIQEVKKLAAAAANTSHLKIHIQCPSDKQPAPQIIAVEKDLLTAVTDVFRLRGIEGSIPSVDELVEPEEEHDIQAEANKVISGDDEIVAHIKQLTMENNGEVIDVDDSKEEESATLAGISFSDASQMCMKLEAACWQFGYSDSGLALPHKLHCFCGFLRHMEMKHAKQSTLDSFWAKQAS
ncbi:hypothetical protein EDD16DRAFT_1704499 [Pisolithus croceorrhizus]|nr:hypothetical protein EDD16DRAFT_1704499 [Pisolithus croceorrhizus]KAI6125253.1 hypothetical protein EV401DRAFT_2068323 [Pisolithus croceorrhizus]KAI6158902.1 hypothetical protein EDD17DRAFT_1763089 [Pisolithus thermaeus]